MVLRVAAATTQCVSCHTDSMPHHANRPTKICACCGRPFQWRKKWKEVWDEVRWCSERCRRAGRRSGQRDMENPRSDPAP